MNPIVATLLPSLMALMTVVCCHFFGNLSTEAEIGVVVWLPNEIPGHSSEEVMMSAAEKKWLPDDVTYWSMIYQPAIGSWANQIKATLIVSGMEPGSLHRPKGCLVSQGWAITKEEIVSLETEGGTLEVMDFHIRRILRDPNNNNEVVKDKDGEPVYLNAHYVYWWVGPHHTTASDKMKNFLMTWSSIKEGRMERWAYPSVMTYVNTQDGEAGENNAQERAYQFIREYAPKFQKSLGASESQEGARELMSLAK